MPIPPFISGTKHLDKLRGQVFLGREPPWPPRGLRPTSQVNLFTWPPMGGWFFVPITNEMRPPSHHAPTSIPPSRLDDANPRSHGGGGG